MLRPSVNFIIKMWPSEARSVKGAKKVGREIFYYWKSKSDNSNHRSHQLECVWPLNMLKCYHIFEYDLNKSGLHLNGEYYHETGWLLDYCLQENKEMKPQ